jgi:hypothetical protein
MATASGLVTTLATWAGLSTAAGGGLWALGGNDTVRRFGRQTLAWGVVDGVIAAVAAALPEPDPRRLKRTLWANSAVDVGYIGVGLWLRRSPQRRGDGTAVVVQGLFLLALDSHFAYHLDVALQA